MPRCSTHLLPYLSRGLWVLGLLLLLNSAASRAQFDTPPAGNWSNSDSDLLTAVQFLPVEEAYRLSARVLDDGRLQLHWDIADGYYLYRKQLQFRIGEAVLEPALPDGQRKYDEYFEEELEVYYGGLEVLLDLPAGLNEQPFRLQVRSQGCADAGLCYPPQIQWLQVADAEATLQAATIGSQPGAAAPVPAPYASGSWAWLAALLGALLGGAILNLMPCVFPVLSLKAVSLASAHDSPRHQRWHGWAYTLGCISLFVLVAAVMLALRQAGLAVGWGFQLQSPLVVAILAYLFFTMGLLFSGNFSLGGGWSGSGQKLTGGHSLRASFFTGALACIVASPCTAPFMGSALGYAVTQPAVSALSIFAALGLGMALPFLLLSHYPKLGRLLPRPGTWMDTLKQALAFPLYLTALWLLWVLGRQAGSDAIILVGSGAVAIAAGLWLLGLRPPPLVRLAGLALLLLALLPLNRLPAAGEAQTPRAEDGWQPYNDARLQQLLDTGTPVFVNLTADWCITCLANEKVVLDTKRIQTAFDNAGVVRLKGDWTHYNPEITDLLARFNRSGVPLYLLYTGNTGQAPEILPQLLSESTLLNALSNLKANNQGF